MLKQVRIGVLVSGGGSNLQALIDAQQAGKLPDGQLAVVLSDRPGVQALEQWGPSRWRPACWTYWSGNTSSWWCWPAF